MKGPAPNNADAVGDRDRNQITATTEAKIQNAGDTLWYGDGCHTAAAIEGSFANAGEKQSRNLCGYLQSRMKAHPALPLLGFLLPVFGRIPQGLTQKAASKTI